MSIVWIVLGYFVVVSVFLIVDGLVNPDTKMYKVNGIWYTQHRLDCGMCGQSGAWCLNTEGCPHNWRENS